MGVFAFSEAALEKCAGTTLLWLGEPKQALIHTRHALALHGSASESWMQMHPLISRFDEAQAWAQLGHPDEAAMLGSQIFTAGRDAAQDVIGPLVHKGRELLEMLAPHGKLAEVRNYTEQFHALTRRPGLALQA